MVPEKIQKSLRNLYATIPQLQVFSCCEKASLRLTYILELKEMQV